jgi:hypothetical protein
MIIDRIIYTNASLNFKLIFHYLLNLGYCGGYLYLHDYFQKQRLELPNQDPFFNSINILNILFFLKMVYLWISAVQISNVFLKNNKRDIRQPHMLIG